MVETKETIIDGLRIATTQFPGREGWKIHIKLLKMFGAPIAELLAHSKSVELSTENNDQDLDLTNLSSAIEKLAINLNPDESLDFVFQLLRFTRIDDKPLDNVLFDSLFIDKLSTLYKIVAFVLKVNFGSFFGKGGIGSIIKNQMPIPPYQKEL